MQDGRLGVVLVIEAGGPCVQLNAAPELCVLLHLLSVACLQAERAALEKAVDEEIAAEAAADEDAKQKKREQIAAEEQRLAEIEEQRKAEVRQLMVTLLGSLPTWQRDNGLLGCKRVVAACCLLQAAKRCCVSQSG